MNKNFATILDAYKAVIRSADFRTAELVENVKFTADDDKGKELIAEELSATIVYLESLRTRVTHMSPEEILANLSTI